MDMFSMHDDRTGPGMQAIHSPLPKIPGPMLLRSMMVIARFSTRMERRSSQGHRPDQLGPTAASFLWEHGAIPIRITSLADR